MIKKVEVAKEILAGLEPHFKEHGFTLDKNKRLFKRNVPECVQIFDMFFYKEPNHITIKPEIRIKVKPIENIYEEASTIEGRPYLTLGNNLFDIVRYIDEHEESGEREKAVPDWLVESQRNIDKLIEVIPQYLIETMLPYFDENSSVTRVDELLNKFPRELSIHNRLFPLRANIAIIAAKLNKNPRYEDLLQIYEEELQEAEETYKEEFYKLKKILKEY